MILILDYWYNYSNTRLLKSPGLFLLLHRGVDERHEKLPQSFPLGIANVFEFEPHRVCPHHAHNPCGRADRHRRRREGKIHGYR